MSDLTRLPDPAAGGDRQAAAATLPPARHRPRRRAAARTAAGQGLAPLDLRQGLAPGGVAAAGGLIPSFPVLALLLVRRSAAPSFSSAALRRDDGFSPLRGADRDPVKD